MEIQEAAWPSDQRNGRVISAMASQSRGPGFEAGSGNLLDLFLVVASSNPRAVGHASK